ncbi:MAG: hypothetical protein KA714_30730 [Limnoraphis sp. WC205]|jgi:hypothetical protein|nr:hypothetical protein [Limnoraphis sp. WC205]
MSKNKFFTNHKNLAIATFTLALVMGSIVALLPKFNQGLQFISFSTSEESLSESALPPTVEALTSVSSTSLDIVDQIVNSLEWGNIAFNTPQKIRLEEPTIIELILSPTQSIEELQSSLESQEKIESAEIRISNRMEANLSGTGFKIEALIPQEQAISRSQTTRWKWEVTPTQDGSQNLSLTLSTIINVSGRDVPLVIQTFNKKIEVEVSVGQHFSTFVAGNWQWLWASILVPTAPFIWKWYRKKQGRNLPA